MAPYEQDQPFTELRQKVGIYIEKFVLRGSPSLDSRNKLFVTKKRNQNS